MECMFVDTNIIIISYYYYSNVSRASNVGMKQLLLKNHDRYHCQGIENVEIQNLFYPRQGNRQQAVPKNSESNNNNST